MHAAELLPQVYNELRKLAAAKLAWEKPGHTLDATLSECAQVPGVSPRTADTWCSYARARLALELTDK